MSAPDYLISTPENVDLHLEFAGIGNRILAALIDTVIVTGALILLTLAVTVIAYCSIPIVRTVAMVVLVVIVVTVPLLLNFFVYIIYCAYCEGNWQGQTIGKKLVGIRVIEQNGQPAGWSSVWIRNLVRIVDHLLGLVGLLVMIMDPNERRLGDLAGNTLVIRERPTSITTSDIKLTATLSDDEMLDAGRLTPQEYDLLLSFLKRRRYLDDAHRPEVAAKMEEYFAKRLDLPKEKANSELFLEKLLLSYQARAEG